MKSTRTSKKSYKKVKEGAKEKEKKTENINRKKLW
jgi:hypothetical protein